VLQRIAALKTAPPEPMAPVLSRIADGVDINFVRVQVQCPSVQQTQALRLQSLHDHEIGYRLITVCPLDGGRYRSLLVDRGFAPMEQAARAAQPGPIVRDPVVGVLRRPDGKTFVTPHNQPQQNLWYWRDIPAMAAALHAERPAPAVLMLERPTPPSGWPTPVPLPGDIPNNHLGYAVTWFGLAAALAGVYLARLLRRRPS
jgi:surfeit locus 1 family protein